MEKEYSNKIHELSEKLAVTVIEKMNSNKDSFVAKYDANDLEKKQHVEKMADISHELMSEISNLNLPNNWATFGIEKIIEELNSIKTFINGTVTAYKDELLSRTVGVKNGDGKYRIEDASIGEILIKLADIREKTGGKASDYFNNLPEELDDSQK